MSKQNEIDIRGFFNGESSSSSDYPAATDSEDAIASEPEVPPSRKKACMSFSSWKEEGI